MFNVLDDENQESGWKKQIEKEIKSLEGCDNLSKEEINAVLNFLIMLAKLEIKINEINNYEKGDIVLPCKHG